MSFLSDKELRRLQQVRQILNEGGNPYSNIATLTLGSGEFINDKKQSLIKSLTPKQRLAKFNATTGSHKWSFNDGIDDTIKFTGSTCISCNDLIEATTCVYGRIIVDKFTVKQDGVRLIKHTLTEYRRIYSVPVYKTGHCCKSCFDTLWADKYLDDKLVLHRSIELLDKPINKTTETISKNHRVITRTVAAGSNAGSNIKRERSTSKSVTTVLIGKDGEAEEWKATLPKPKPEPVDVNCYRYFTRGR